MRAKAAVGLVCLVVLTLTLHTTVLEKVAVGGVKPDLLLAITVYVSLGWGGTAGTLCGFLLGILQDAQSAGPLGLNAAAKAVAGFAMSYTWEALDRESVYSQMLIIFAASLLHSLVFWTLYSVSELGSVPWLLVRFGAPGALYTALLAPLLALVVQRAGGFRMRLRALPKKQK